MRIDDVRPDRLKNEITRPAPAGPAPAQPIAPAEPLERGDSVIISEQARALAAAADGPISGSLAPERLAELRRWLAAGGHNDPEVLRQVATRIIATGDLDAPATTGDAAP